MKAIQWIISALVAVVIIAAAVGGGVYFTRLKSIHSIRKLTDYENYNLYRMDIDYAYDLDRLIDRGITDNQSMINAILAEALPYPLDTLTHGMGSKRSQAEATKLVPFIEEMNRGLNPHFQETHPKPETPAPFYVLSNRSGINGAACILYEDVLKNFADGVEKNLIILPSSIHEVLLLPDDGDISYEEMSRLVTHINRSEVPEEDRLSNQVYLYSRETGEVTMASSGPASIC